MTLPILVWQYCNKIRLIQSKMKKKLFLLALSCMVLSSCMTTKIPHLVGNYTATTSIETDKSFDEVWGKVIDFFATSGIPISTLEKASGLIVSNKVALEGMTTTEKDGVILNPNAYIVIPYVKGSTNLQVTSDFNVRVKEQNGKVLISVNLPNIKAQLYVLEGLYVRVPTAKSIEAKSTGVFENGLLNLLK